MYSLKKMGGKCGYDAKDDKLFVSVYIVHQGFLRINIKLLREKLHGLIVTLKYTVIIVSYQELVYLIRKLNSGYIDVI